MSVVPTEFVRAPSGKSWMKSNISTACSPSAGKIQKSPPASASTKWLSACKRRCRNSRRRRRTYPRLRLCPPASVRAASLEAQAARAAAEPQSSAWTLTEEEQTLILAHRQKKKKKKRKRVQWHPEVVEPVRKSRRIRGLPPQSIPIPLAPASHLYQVYEDDLSPQSSDSEGEPPGTVYAIDEIVDERWTPNHQYLVKWTGYGWSENSWISDAQMVMGQSELLRAWHEETR